MASALAALASIVPPPTNPITEISASSSSTDTSATVIASASAPEPTPPTPSATPVPSASSYRLDVNRYRDPLVIEPPREEGVRYPVFVVAHGAHMTPEEMCDPLRDILGSRAFVLCPVGVISSFGPNRTELYAFEGPAAIADEVDAGLDALAAKFGDSVDIKNPVYLGFSQGAIQGAELLASEGEPMPRGIFVEGGHDLWAPFRVNQYAKRGGKRILFATGSDNFEQKAKIGVPYFKGTPVEVQHVHVAGEGHHFSPKIIQAVADNLEWVLEGDDRF